VVLVAAALAASGCGTDDARRSGDRGELVVSAATSLKTAMTEYAGDLGLEVRLSFGGSDELAAQIRQGVRPDVFAAANATLPQQLFKEGLVEEPVAFAGNRLVIAVPADDCCSIHSIEDLGEPDVRVALGAPSVPVGGYARDALERAGPPVRDAVLANVRSEEPDVAGVIGKVSQGAVDAGLVYRTDVQAARGAVRGIELPDRLQPPVSYAAAVVKDAPNGDAARRFVAGLLDGAGEAALQRAGFTRPPQ
jgi:molybdate transport system substrate-binding protein